jgi:membrane-associated phospholipid phosphatase
MRPPSTGIARSVPRAPIRVALVLVVSLAALVLVVVAWGWLLTHPLESSVGRSDDDLARWFAARRTPRLSDVADVGTLLGETWMGELVLGVVGVASALLARSWRPLLFVAVMYGGVGVVYFVATHVDHRDRPPVTILDAGLVPDRSFPSGHVGTVTAIVVCVALLLVAYRVTTSRWLVLLAVLPALTLTARLYQGAHHLTDVLTSLVAAGVWGSVSARQLLPRTGDRPVSGAD